jgi:3-hydroxybutyryl-CoA dehydratase
VETPRQLHFEDIQLGDLLPEREHGPLSIVDMVRWASLQENWAHLHFDRDYVREHNRMKTFIASGAYRQALLLRMLTDWIGPRGFLRKLSLRHTYATFEGDLCRFGGKVVDKSAIINDAAASSKGKTRRGREILRGSCTVTLPLRAGA